MKLSVLLILVPLFLWSSKLCAQTKIIAHKSHSGRISSFSIDHMDNFGAIPFPFDLHRLTKVVSVKKISPELLVLGKVSTLTYSLEEVQDTSFDTVATATYLRPPYKTLDAGQLYQLFPDAKISGFGPKLKVDRLPMLKNNMGGDGLLILLLLCATLAVSFGRMLWKNNLQLFNNKP